MKNQPPYDPEMEAEERRQREEEKRNGRLGKHDAGTDDADNRAAYQRRRRAVMRMTQPQVTQRRHGTNVIAKTAITGQKIFSLQVSYYFQLHSQGSSGETIKDCQQSRHRQNADQPALQPDQVHQRLNRAIKKR